MDSLTHIVLGACIGEAIAGKKAGRFVLVAGALAQSLPDADFVTSWFLPVSSDLLAHRGFTHSLLFAAIAAPLLGLAFKRVYDSTQKTKPPLGWASWSLLCLVEILTHIGLDCFNVYGTGIFEPFSHLRVSLNTLYVADPIFTIVPLVSALSLSLYKRKSAFRMKASLFSICWCAAYLFFATGVRAHVAKKVNQELTTQHLPHNQILLTPTLLNSLLWYYVAETDSGFYTGYSSILETAPETESRFIPRRAYLLHKVKDQTSVYRLVRFSQGFYAVGYRHDSLVFQDLRFGETDPSGLTPPQSAFYYFLEYPTSNNMIIQRGRVNGWNREKVHAFLNRILGRHTVAKKPAF